MKKGSPKAPENYQREKDETGASPLYRVVLSSYLSWKLRLVGVRASSDTI